MATGGVWILRAAISRWLLAISLWPLNFNKQLKAWEKGIKMRNFRKLDIWNDGISIVKKVYQLSASLPSEEKFGLRSQICRAAVSIPSNIAEGCSRTSEKDFQRFLEIAIGSAFELEPQFILILEMKLAPNSDIQPIIEQ